MGSNMAIFRLTKGKKLGYFFFSLDSFILMCYNVCFVCVEVLRPSQPNGVKCVMCHNIINEYESFESTGLLVQEKLFKKKKKKERKKRKKKKLLFTDACQ